MAQVSMKLHGDPRMCAPVCLKSERLTGNEAPERPPGIDGLP
jgi:hypothetical protein